MFLDVSEHINIDYDRLREKEVVEFFYILKKFEQKLNAQKNSIPSNR